MSPSLSMSPTHAPFALPGFRNASPRGGWRLRVISVNVPSPLFKNTTLRSASFVTSRSRWPSWLKSVQFGEPCAFALAIRSVVAVPVCAVVSVNVPSPSLRNMTLATSYSGFLTYRSRKPSPS